MNAGWIEFGSAEGTFVQFDFCTFTGSGSFLFGKTSGLAEFGMAECNNCDFSGFSGTIVNLSDFYHAHFKFSKCLFPSSYSLVDQVPNSKKQTVEAFNCDDGDTQYNIDCYYAEGHVISAVNCYDEATVDGSTGYSIKLISENGGYNVDRWNPLRFKLGEVYSPNANPTITVRLLTDGVTLQDDECWVEIAAPDDTNGCLGLLQSSRASDPINPSSLSSGSAWDTEDLGSDTELEIAVNVSGGAAGVHEVWINLAKPNTTVYVDPHFTLT